MSFDQELVEGLKELTNDRKATEVIPIMVMSVNEDKMTVDGMDQDSVDHFDIRIQASEESTKGSFIIPAVGSWILASNIGKVDTTFFVVASTEIQKAAIRIGQFETEINDQGISVRKGTADLKSAMDDLITAIKAITVTTAQGPSSTPLNFASFDIVKTKLNQLLR